MRNKIQISDEFVRRKNELHDKTRDPQKTQLYAADHATHATFPQTTVPQIMLKRIVNDVCDVFGVQPPRVQPSPRLKNSAKAEYNHPRFGPVLKIGGHGTGGQRKKNGELGNSRGGGWTVHVGVILHELAHILTHYHTKKGVHHNPVYAGVLVATYAVASDLHPDNVPQNIVEIATENYLSNGVQWENPEKIEFIRG